MTVAALAPSPADSGVPFVEWPDFRRALNWRQGEHVSVFGQTGSGKTWLCTELVDERGWVAAFGVKPKDESLDYLIKSKRYKRLYAWPPKPHQRRVVLWPHIRTSDDITDSQPTFKRAVDSIFSSLSWCLYLDEARYLTERLNLRQELIDMWCLGRAGRLSVLAGSQRPAWVPVEMRTEARHLFIFATHGKDDLDALKQVGRADAGLVRDTIQALPDHHFLYVNRVTGELAVSKVEKGG